MSDEKLDANASVNVTQNVTDGTKLKDSTNGGNTALQNNLESVANANENQR